MRHTNYHIGFLICLVLMSCDKESLNNANHFFTFQNRSENYTLRAVDQYLLLLKTAGAVEKDIYILEKESNQHFTSYLEVSHIAETKDGIEVRLLDGKVLKLSVGIQIEADYNGYSLSKVSGPYHYRLFYGDSGVLNEPDVNSIKCKCNENKTVENCDSGGKGSADCSISGSATGGGTGIQEKCSVKCANGYYACCKSV